MTYRPSWKGGAVMMQAPNPTRNNYQPQQPPQRQPGYAAMPPQGQPAPQYQQPPVMQQPSAAQQYAAPAPQMPQSAPQQIQPAPQQNQPDPDFISQKIAKINAKDKVVDFNSFLCEALVGDYAMVHGCGGTGHARNSTIGVKICDYTKGTGDKSTTLKFCVDVEDMELLYQAAMKARMGEFEAKGNVTGVMQIADNLAGNLNAWAQALSTQQASVTADQLNWAVGQLMAMRNASSAAAGTPLFSYTREKVDPYKVDANGMAPVSKISILYTPIRKDGQQSKYPWYVEISNFIAPFRKKSTGATIYDGSKATAKRSAFINISEDDFAAAMVAVNRHIRLWEHRTLPIMEEALRRMEAHRQGSQQ